MNGWLDPNLVFVFLFDYAVNKFSKDTVHPSMPPTVVHTSSFLAVTGWCGP
jgi:hypothetical protein